MNLFSPVRTARAMTDLAAAVIAEAIAADPAVVN